LWGFLVLISFSFLCDGAELMNSLHTNVYFVSFLTMILNKKKRHLKSASTPLLPTVSQVRMIEASLMFSNHHTISFNSSKSY